VPEGHTLHRVARQHGALLTGRRVRADSPQGRFAAGARRIDGNTVGLVEAYGKHVFYEIGAAATSLLHVHLGLYGSFRDGPAPAPPPRGAVRLRLCTDEHWIELRGATAAELITRPERDAIVARLGPDPLRRDANPQAFVTRAGASRAPIATLLMDQRTLAGVGNVYRAELLYRAGIEPHRSGRDVGAGALAGLWTDAVRLMRAGLRTGRIVTTDPADRDHPRGPVRPEDAHYVYRRHGLPCRRCRTEIRKVELAGRNLFWCPICQH
jgi:endonuclease-8